MPKFAVAALLALMATCLASPAQARIWTDVTGKYTIEADLIAFDDEHAILQRESKELGAFPIEKLSKTDREFLKSKEASQINDGNLNKSQTWTTKDGLKFVGRIVDYARREISIQRRRGKTYVDNYVYRNLPPIYQEMLPRIVSHLESIKVADRDALEIWARDLRGKPRKYKLEGVILELENGNEYGVPFFLFSLKDQQLLKAGWNQWLEDREDYNKRDDNAFRLEALSAAYQRDRAVDRQIAIANLNMQAIQAGLTSAWEVTLYPKPGNPYPPRWVIALGRDSLAATQAALRQNPGFRDGPVRRVSGRR